MNHNEYIIKELKGAVGQRRVKSEGLWVVNSEGSHVRRNCFRRAVRASTSLPFDMQTILNTRILHDHSII